MPFACMPACLSCEEAGECEKTWRRQERIDDSKWKGQPKAVHQRAVSAAIEASKAPYIHLPCGCLTTVEEQEFWSYWRPKAKDAYCERGHGWQELPRKPKPKPVPQEPLF